MRPGQDQSCNQIAGTAELQAVRSPDSDVRALSRRELADVVATEQRRAATRAESQSLAGVHCRRPTSGARDEQGLLDLQEEVAALVRGRPVDAKSDSYFRVQQFAHARDAGPE